MFYHVVSYDTKRVVTQCQGLQVNDLRYYVWANVESRCLRFCMEYSAAKFLVDRMYKRALMQHLPENAPEWSAVIAPRDMIQIPRVVGTREDKSEMVYI